MPLRLMWTRMAWLVQLSTHLAGAIVLRSLQVVLRARASSYFYMRLGGTVSRLVYAVKIEGFHAALCTVSSPAVGRTDQKRDCLAIMG